MGAILTLGYPCQPSIAKDIATRAFQIFPAFPKILSQYSKEEPSTVPYTISLSADIFVCDSFQTESGIRYFKRPITIQIDVVDEYLCASHEELRISVLEKDLASLKEYFFDVLSCDYKLYTSTPDDQLTKKALELKKWYINNVI